MKITLGAVLGVALVVLWLNTWRAFLGWALSRGDAH